MSAIAVIVPARNAAATLADALAAVHAQTQPAAELIVCDDGSSDDTAGIAAAHGATVVTTKGEGPAAARALAIAASTAPYLALLDADDVWDPDHLATLERVRGDDVVAMADLRFWVPGVGIGTTWSSRFRIPARRQLERLYRENYVNSCTRFTRELYDRVGGFRGPERVGEDWDLWIRMLRAGATVVMADHPTVRYRMRPATDGAIADRLSVLERAARESTSARERRAVRAGIRRVGAERDLFDAYAGGTRPWRALRGSSRVAARAALMVVAPRWTAARRAAAVADPGHRLKG